MFTNARAALPKQRMNGRRLIVVDIENLVGGAVLETDDARWAKRCLAEVADVSNDDQVVIGTSHIGLLPSAIGWPGQRYVVGSGPDGADLALLGVLDEGLAERYGEIILASGDGIFTDAVSRLTAKGVTVHVVAHADGLSRRLHMAASSSSSITIRYNPERSLGAA